MNKYKAYSYLIRCPGSMRLAELYDDDSELREALATLIPDFEYPDWAYKRLHEIVHYMENEE